MHASMKPKNIEFIVWISLLVSQ